MSTDNVDFCSPSRPYQREVFGPSGPGPLTVVKTLFVFLKKKVRFRALRVGATPHKARSRVKKESLFGNVIWSNVCFFQAFCPAYIRPRMEKSHSSRPRTGGFPILYWLVVNRSLLRLLSTNILVNYSLAVNLNIKVSKTLYH